MVDIIERRGKEAFLDSLFVMEEGMRHYFSKAMQAKTNNMKPEIVDNYMHVTSYQNGREWKPLRIRTSISLSRIGTVPTLGGLVNSVSFDIDEAPFSPA